MRCSIVSGIFFLIFLSACGQAPRKPYPVSKADSLKINTFEYKSRFFQNKAPDSAIYFADRGLKLCHVLHYKLGEGIMLNQFARINEQYGNLKLAIRHQKEAASIFKSLHSALSYEADLSMGILQGKIGNISSGTKLITTTFKHYKNQRDTAGMIKSYAKLGEIKQLGHHLTQALLYYNKAEQLQKGKPVTADYFNLIGSIAALHTRLGNYRNAANYYQKGIDQSGALAHLKFHISFLNNAGQTWDKLKDKDQALAYHQQALAQAKSNGLPEEQARSLIAIAHVQRSQDADQSILHLKKALNIAHFIGNRQLSQEIYYSLWEIYRQQARYMEALKALEQHHLLFDSLKIANMGHKIAALQSSYELTESKLHIESLEVSNLHKTEQRNIGLLFAAAVLVLLIFSSIYLHKTKRLNQRLKDTNLVKDKLFSIIGHDLRNPIGGITQLLAIIEEGGLSEQEQHEMIVEMRKQGNVSLEILNALLNWGESQLKGIRVNPSNFNAKSSISKNIQALQKHATDKSVQITDHVPVELQVYGDIIHFEFIIRNMLSNAIKFSHPGGKIEIGATVKPGAHAVTFSVQDFGEGISKKQQELFLKSNLDVSFGTAGEKGTGIGLMLSKEFTKANNGKIWVESKEGEGATFYFTFPTSTIAPYTPGQ